MPSRFGAARTSTLLDNTRTCSRLPARTSTLLDNTRIYSRFQPRADLPRERMHVTPPCTTFRCAKGPGSVCAEGPGSACAEGPGSSHHGRPVSRRPTRSRLQRAQHAAPLRTASPPRAERSMLFAGLPPWTRLPSPRGSSRPRKPSARCSSRASRLGRASPLRAGHPAPASRAASLDALRGFPPRPFSAGVGPTS